MDKKLYIIRCSDGWLRSYYGTYKGAVLIGQAYADKFGVTYAIA